MTFRFDTKTFHCKVKDGSLRAVSKARNALFHKFLKEIENEDVIVEVSITLLKNRINEQQHKLIKAFILKGMEVFGVDYDTMVGELSQFFPKSIVDNSRLPFDQWNNEQLSDFLNVASAHLIEMDPNFKF